MDDQAKWLRRRIEERLYLARNAIELGNSATWTEMSSGVLMTVAPDAPQDQGGTWGGVHPLGDSSLTRLMEANDPADTIARCEAELAILDLHGGEWLDQDLADGDYRVRQVCTRCDDGYWPCRTVRLLASGYRHRPGYREEWKP